MFLCIQKDGSVVIWWIIAIWLEIQQINLNVDKTKPWYGKKICIYHHTCNSLITNGTQKQRNWYVKLTIFLFLSFFFLFNCSEQFYEYLLGCDFNNNFIFFRYFFFFAFQTLLHTHLAVDQWKDRIEITEVQRTANTNEMTSMCSQAVKRRPKLR